MRPNRPSMLGVPDRRPDRSPGVEGASGKMPPAHQTLGGRGPLSSRGSRWGAWRGSRPRPAGTGARPSLTRFLTSADSPYEGPLLNCVELMAGGAAGRDGTGRAGPGRRRGTRGAGRHAPAADWPPAHMSL